MHYLHCLCIICTVDAIFALFMHYLKCINGALFDVKQKGCRQLQRWTTCLCTSQISPFKRRVRWRTHCSFKMSLPVPYALATLFGNAFVHLTNLAIQKAGEHTSNDDLLLRVFCVLAAYLFTSPTWPFKRQVTRALVMPVRRCLNIDVQQKGGRQQQRCTTCLCASQISLFKRQGHTV